LTMVGCGVFGNDPDYIIRALNYMKGFIQNSGLNVTLVWYDSSRHLPVINNNTFRDQLARIVHETGGQYRQHSNAHPEGIDPTTQAPQFNIPPQQ